MLKMNDRSMIELELALEAIDKGSPITFTGTGIIKVQNPNYDPSRENSRESFELSIDNIKSTMAYGRRNEIELIQLRDKHQNAKAFLNLAVELLVLFREFVIKNATVWKLGSSHHHPMWVTIASLIEKYNTDYPMQQVEKEVNKGPRYQFIVSTNTETLETLIEKDRKRHGLDS